MQSQRGYFSSLEKIRMILRIHAAMFLPFVVAYYVYYFATLHGMVDRDGNPFGRDFTFFWRAIQLIKSGDVSGIYSPDVYAGEMRRLFSIPIECTWPYPPYFLFLLWPFTFFTSYGTAYGAWEALNMGAFTFALFWRSPLSWDWRLILVSAPMVLLNPFVGQNVLLISALIIGGFRLLSRMPVLAGVLFGLAAFKPQLAFLMPFVLLALRRYRALASAALTVGGMALASVLVFGWDNWRSFFANLSDLSQHLPGRMISPYAALQLLGVSPHAALSVHDVLAVVVVLLLCLKLGRMRGEHWTQWLKLTAPAMYLVTPYGFIYNLCFLNAVWVLWLARQEKAALAPSSTVLWLMLWYAAIFHQALDQAGIPLIPVLLLLAFLVEWRRPIREGKTQPNAGEMAVS
jgi:hypothetical protein